MALGQSKHVAVKPRDTKGSISLPLKPIALSRTTALGFQWAGRKPHPPCFPPQCCLIPAEPLMASYHISNLIINQSSSRRPYLVLPSDKLVLKEKQKKKLERVKWQPFFPHFCRPGIIGADATTHVVSRTQAERCYWAFPRQLQSWQAFPGHPSGLSVHGMMEGHTQMTDRMLSPRFNFIEHGFAIFFFL